ncbi:pilus assembly protein TadG-related protein [Aeoliella sp. SH292]|uniref:pilus assembly protein TadG-related protein n=1 Tax=Aeoliella sp. SH292 TaxID=3454464 RepID=UPI003F985C56
MRRPYLRNRRQGKILVLLCLLLPTLVGVVGLVIDSGMMFDRREQLQGVADAGAAAAAFALMQGESPTTAVAMAESMVAASSQTAAAVTVNIPPLTGNFAGLSTHAEVIVSTNYAPGFARFVPGTRRVEARCVAGASDATAGAAIVVLDPNPDNLSLGGLPEILSNISVSGIANSAVPQTGVTQLVESVPLLGNGLSQILTTSLEQTLSSTLLTVLNQVTSSISLTPLPSLVAGLEVEGAGRLIVQGAVLVNTGWGGLDQHSNLVGDGPAPPWGVACMPILPTTQIQAEGIRVVGGVDHPEMYVALSQGAPKPLQANRLPVPDPLASLPVPSLASDSANVIATAHDPGHSIRIAVAPAHASALLTDLFNSLSFLLKPLLTPLLGDLTELLCEPTLEPGVYDSITVISRLGGARFEPGVYVIRGKSPATQMSLCILGPVQAEGVMFYITDSAGFSASTGSPDTTGDPEASPPSALPGLLPSTLIAMLLPGGALTGLNDAGSPFDGMLLYQRRQDRRPIILEAQQLLGGGDITGTIYAKWGHVTFVGGAGTYDMRFVAGTMRVVTVTNTVIAPTTLLAPARDVLLFE